MCRPLTVHNSKHDKKRRSSHACSLALKIAKTVMRTGIRYKDPKHTNYKMFHSLNSAEN